MWNDIRQDPGFGDPNFLKKEDATKKKAWTNFLNRFPKADKSRFISQAMINEKKRNCRGVFQRKRKLVSNCLRLRQKILERGNETSAWFGRQRGFSLPIIAAWLKSFIAHPCGTFRWQSAKLEKNIQRHNPNLHYA